MATPRSSDRFLAAATAAIVLAFVLHAAPSARIPLANDEYMMIERNIDHGLLQSFNPLANDDFFYRPAVHSLYYRSLYALFDTWALPYHLVNFLLVALNASLVLVIGRRLGGSREAGLLAAALFIANPAMLRIFMVVGNITDIAMTAFGLLCVWFYLGFRAGRPRPWLLGASTLCYLFSLLCKEMGLLLPGWLLALELVQPGEGSPRRWRPLGRLAPFAVIAAAYLVFRAATFPGEDRSYTFSLFGRHLLTNFDYYISFLPAALFGFEPPRLPAPAYTVAVGAAILLAAWRRETRGLAALGLGWFVLAILPLLPLVQRTRDYYLAYAGIGVFWFFGAALAGILRRWSATRMPAMVAAYLVLLAAVSSCNNYHRVQESWFPRWAALTEGLHQAVKAAKIDFPPGARVVIVLNYDF